jgi:hypothetical protein
MLGVPVMARFDFLREFLGVGPTVPESMHYRRVKELQDANNINFQRRRDPVARGKLLRDTLDSIAGNTVTDPVTRSLAREAVERFDLSLA